MINGMPIFYNSKIGRGLEPVQIKERALNQFKLKREKDVTKYAISKRI